MQLIGEYMMPPAKTRFVKLFDMLSACFEEITKVIDLHLAEGLNSLR